jgi:hypothetical protein
LTAGCVVVAAELAADMPGTVSTLAVEWWVVVGQSEVVAAGTGKAVFVVLMIRGLEVDSAAR